MLLMRLPKYYTPMVMGLEASGMAMKAGAIKLKIVQEVKTTCNEKMMKRSLVEVILTCVKEEEQ